MPNGNQFIINDVANSIDFTSTILLLLCTALVLFMVPGLGIFYGGLERRKNVSTIIAQSFISIPIVTLIWIFGGFSLAFGTSLGGVIGNPVDFFCFRNILFTKGWSQFALVTNVTIANGVPFIAFFFFQLAFAIITPALVSGAFADRLNFRGYILFTILFTLFIYIPVCHWIWGQGFLAQWGGIDWAGGVVIHATCGMAAIGSVIVLKKRSILNYEYTSPHSLPLVAVGAAILFFGWFGFNVGGATYAPFPAESTNDIAQAIAAGTLLSENSNLLTVGVSAFINSFVAMSGAMIIWVIIDLFRKRHTSLLSILTSGVAGLATITPAAGFVPIWSALVFGIAGALICYTMTWINHKSKFDDALEVWPVHGIGGITGSLLLAGFASMSINSVLLGQNQGLDSMTQLGSVALLVSQIIMIAIVCAWTLVISLISFLFIVLLKGKTTKEEQEQGLDKTLFQEFSYSKGVNKELRSIELANKQKAGATSLQTIRESRSIESINKQKTIEVENTNTVKKKVIRIKPTPSAAKTKVAVKATKTSNKSSSKKTSK